MRSRPTASGNTAKNRNAGFSMLELMVVIIVFGILCGAAAVSWSSFTRYQNLRSEANGFHKDLLALRARALQNNDTIRVNLAAGSYAVTQSTEDSGDPWTAVKTVTLGHGITMSTAVPANRTGLPSVVDTSNSWAKNDNRIQILPDNLSAFTNGFATLEVGGNQFCVVMDQSIGIAPTIFFRKGGGSWKRM